MNVLFIISDELNTPTKEKVSSWIASKAKTNDML